MHPDHHRMRGARRLGIVLWRLRYPVPQPHVRVLQGLASQQLEGTELREPYSAPLGDGIFELRCKLGSNITRALYFFYIGKHIVVINGFVKKTQKTPPAEIKLAKDRRKDWLRRHEQDNNGSK